MKTLRVLLPAGQVPCGCVVTKRAADKEYVIEDSTKIRPGLRYLEAKGGDINMVDGDTLLLAELTMAQIKEVMSDD